MYLVIRQGFYVVFDVFRVGCDHRAVVVVSGTRNLFPLVRNTRIEDKLFIPTVLDYEKRLLKND